MDKRGKSLFAFRLIGALIGAVGFILLAYRMNVIGTALIGIGSLIISAAGGH